jgi:hypothetical protein
MQQLQPQLIADFQRRLDQAHVAHALHQNYHQWVGFYIAFSEKAKPPDRI